MSARPLDVRGILERAGADAQAAEGTQAWALAQVDAAVNELVMAAQVAESRLLTLDNMQLRELPPNEDVRERLNAALARIEVWS